MDGTPRCPCPRGVDTGPGVPRVVPPYPPTAFRGKGLGSLCSQAVPLAEETDLSSRWLSEVTQWLPVTTRHSLPTRSGSAHCVVSARQGPPCCACVGCPSSWLLVGVFPPPPPHLSPAALDLALSEQGSTLSSLVAPKSRARLLCLQISWCTPSALGLMELRNC